MVVLFLVNEYAVHGIEGPVSGIPLTSDSGKKKILLLKGKQREVPKVGLILHVKFSPLFISIWLISNSLTFINHLKVLYFLKRK